MCGITGIVNISKKVYSIDLQKSTSIINHRGPDDEGFLLWNVGERLPFVYSGLETNITSKTTHNLQNLPPTNQWQVGLGHRRLSILDLSPAGHQPMTHQPTGLAISFNGEVYNYKELRPELEALGYRFDSQSDTEVILKAWAAWGEDCLHKFNGMFAFLILDPRKGGKLFAVRDRFGVKPLYWTKNQDYYAFASEIKQLKTLPSYQSKLNNNIAYDYLVHAQLDHTTQTFDENIQQLQGGQMMEVDLASNAHTLKTWYSLPEKKWEGNEKQAIEKFEELLTDSVRLRMRADVPVGSCLSGGLDSSAIVCLMEKVLRGTENKGIQTITACFENKKYDEWEFAKAVVDKTNANAHRIFPSFNNLQKDLEKLLWHMDEPFGSTSQFSQWCVFKGAADAGLKVMLDGQGSDEQLAGYNSNEQPMYAGLLSKFKLLSIAQEAYSFKNTNGVYPIGQLLGAIRSIIPQLDAIIPFRYRPAASSRVPDWIAAPYKELEGNFQSPKSLRDTLYQQTHYTSLPVLLRYEDRNSMAWSIESRVPFMDYRFVEFALSLPENLVYRKGVKKYVLREAMRNTFPEKIYQRRDKMGFVTPEEVWLKGEGKDWFVEAIETAILQLPELISPSAKEKTLRLINGQENFDFSYWRLACMGQWLK